MVTVAEIWRFVCLGTCSGMGALTRSGRIHGVINMY